MSASPEMLEALVSSKRSVHTKSSNERTIAIQVQTVKSAIESIVSITRDISGSPQLLETHLGVISTFFREQAFQPTVLPVLQQIAKDDIEIWKSATVGDTQMPLTPQAFENIKKSTKEIRGAHGVILVPLQQEREIALLSVYDVTLEVIGETFRILGKKQLSS